MSNPGGEKPTCRRLYTARRRINEQKRHQARLNHVCKDYQVCHDLRVNPRDEFLLHRLCSHWSTEYGPKSSKEWVLLEPLVPSTVDQIQSTIFQRVRLSCVAYAVDSLLDMIHNYLMDVFLLNRWSSHQSTRTGPQSSKRRVREYILLYIARAVISPSDTVYNYQLNTVLLHRLCSLSVYKICSIIIQGMYSFCTAHTVLIEYGPKLFTEFVYCCTACPFIGVLRLVNNYPRDAVISFTTYWSNSLLRSGLLSDQYNCSTALTANIFGWIPMFQRVYVPASGYAGEQVPGQGQVLNTVSTAPIRLNTPVSTINIVPASSVCQSVAISHSCCQQIMRRCKPWPTFITVWIVILLWSWGLKFNTFWIILVSSVILLWWEIKCNTFSINKVEL